MSEQLVCGRCGYHEFFVKSEGIVLLFADGSQLNPYGTGPYQSFVCACCGAENARGDLVIVDALSTQSAHQVKGGAL